MLLLEARKLKDDDSFDDDRSLLADQTDFDLDLNLDYESDIPMGNTQHSNEFPF